MKDGKLENNIKKMGFKEGHSKVRGTDGKSMAILSFESWLWNNQRGPPDGLRLRVSSYRVSISIM